MTGSNGKDVFFVMGGDERFSAVANGLMMAGYDVSTYGLEGSEFLMKEVPRSTDWKRTLGNVSVLILPMPVTQDQIRLHTPLCALPSPTLDAIAERLPEGIRVFGGRLQEPFLECWGRHADSITDYYADETLQILNAVPTAEGALAIAIREMRVTLFGCRAAVIGFGRCGRVLASKLKALGVRVSVAARKASDLAFAEAEGYEVLRCDAPADLDKLATGYDLLCNTVPARLFDEEWIRKAVPGPLCLELASAPGAFDREAAGRAGLSLIVCPSLPGRFSPDSSGRLILRTVLATLQSGRPGNERDINERNSV